MSSKELRECPFCGDKNTKIGSDGYGGWYIDCGRMHIFHYCKCSKEHAIQLWNTRPAENSLKSENARLKESIKEILNIADNGLDIGIEFIGAGLDGMTGGVEEWEDMKRARRKVRKLAKEALKNNNPDMEKGGKMSSNTSKYACPKCGNPNTHIERRPNGFCYCPNCQHRWQIGESQPKPTVFDRVTESHDALAEKFIFKEWHPIERCYVWYSLLFNNEERLIYAPAFETKEEALTATLEKLKEPFSNDYAGSTVEG